jgi:hypothetical protein
LGQTTTPTDVLFSSDGVKMFVIGSLVYQYALSTAWDVSTASYDNKSFAPNPPASPSASAFSADGTKLYLLAGGLNTVYQWEMSLWKPVTTTSSPVRAYDSANLTNGGDTTQQISSGTFVVDNNGVCEDGTAGPTAFAGSDKAEYEFTVEFIAADLLDSDVIYFRIGNVNTYI